ncbi:MAG: hypothetical protein ACRDP8_17920 [Actinopolymorphaceae bacterium]
MAGGNLGLDEPLGTGDVDGDALSTARTASHAYLVRQREALVYDLTGSESPDRRSSATHDIWITDVEAQGRKPGMHVVHVGRHPNPRKPELVIDDRNAGTKETPTSGSCEHGWSTQLATPNILEQ